nr:MAG TPA: hypothetical protein [Caudoviricetes sp.]
MVLRHYSLTKVQNPRRNLYTPIYKAVSCL